MIFECGKEFKNYILPLSCNGEDTDGSEKVPEMAAFILSATFSYQSLIQNVLWKQSKENNPCKVKVQDSFHTFLLCLTAEYKSQPLKKFCCKYKVYKLM